MENSYYRKMKERYETGIMNDISTFYSYFKGTVEAIIHSKYYTDTEKVEELLYLNQGFNKFRDDYDKGLIEKR